MPTPKHSLQSHKSLYRKTGAVSGKGQYWLSEYNLQVRAGAQGGKGAAGQKGCNDIIISKTKFKTKRKWS